MDSSSDAGRAVAEKLCRNFPSGTPDFNLTAAGLDRHMQQRFPISEEALPAVDDALALPPGLLERLSYEELGL